MGEIFISYKREDQPIAELLNEALERRGWSVWWDPELRAGDRFDNVIEQALDRASCIIVLWSRLSVESQYVIDEASYGLEHGKLVPVAMEEVELPFRFAGLHTERITDFDNLETSSEFEKVVDAVSNHHIVQRSIAQKLGIGKSHNIKKLLANKKHFDPEYGFLEGLFYGFIILGMCLFSITLFPLLFVGVELLVSGTKLKEYDFNSSNLLAPSLVSLCICGITSIYVFMGRIKIKYLKSAIVYTSIVTWIVFFIYI